MLRALCTTTLLLSKALASRSDGAIERDVCIIGGGASGTHAAIQLQLKGKSVALIEREPQLGGHVNTYRDPKTGGTFDYGVVVYSNISAVTEFFQHFNVPLGPEKKGRGANVAMNFQTGQKNTNPPAIFGSRLNAALQQYAQHIKKYPGIEQEWTLPHPVPDELLMPFGDFIKKYDLDPISAIAFLHNQGAGNSLAQPTVYLMKYLNLQQIQDQFHGGLANQLNNNQLLYDKAAAELGINAIVSSYPSYVERFSDHVDVSIVTPSGTQLIRAKKLLISIEPLVNSLNFMDLDTNEKNIFGQFNNSYLFDAVVQNTGIPDNTSLRGNDVNASFQVPAMPTLYSIAANDIPGLKSVYYGASHFTTEEDAKAGMLKMIVTARQGLGYPAPPMGPQIVDFRSHSPFELTVSVDAIRNGFYKDLQALQGQRNTFYTGAAWNSPSSSTLWKFNNEIILPRILQSLNA